MNIIFYKSTSKPAFWMAVDARLNVNASFHIGLEGSFAFPDPVFFFLALLPFTIKYT